MMPIPTATRSRRASHGGVLDGARTIVERCLAREYLSLALDRQTHDTRYDRTREVPTFAEYRDGFNCGTSRSSVAAIPLLYACGPIAAFIWALTL